MNAMIRDTFARLRADGQMALMPFVSCGDPDMAMTQSFITTLTGAGADLIEVGFPYSDPIADGPVIQASYTRALDSGCTVDAIFDAVAALADREIPPLVAMVSQAIVYRHGVDVFVERASAAGFSGLLIPDLPSDEADDAAASCASRGLDLIQLIAPTTPVERAKRILQTASGFVYCISTTGTTGVRRDLPESLLQQLNWLRDETELPLAVGFGISRPEHVDSLAGYADGAIVGSALVRQLGELGDQRSRADVLASIEEITQGLANAAHRAR